MSAVFAWRQLIHIQIKPLVHRDSHREDDVMDGGGSPPLPWRQVLIHSAASSSYPHPQSQNLLPEIEIRKKVKSYNKLSSKSQRVTKLVTGLKRG